MPGKGEKASEVLVTGSVAIDTVTTPHGKGTECLGGSAIYFSMAAGLFAPVRLVGVVGGDFQFDLDGLFKGRNIDLSGLQTRQQSRTFRWTGSYEGTMEQANTEALELNVLSEEPPVVPKGYRNSRYVFLANTSPLLQHVLLDQLSEPVFVAADSMNCWIQGQRSQLDKLLQRIDCFLVNAEEARLLTGCHNLVEAARQIVQAGPHVVVIKKGESGSLLWTDRGHCFALPAYPAGEVKDPTGAGDSFAGGFLGCLAAMGIESADDFAALKTAVAYGTVVASFTVSDFSVRGLAAADRSAVDGRFQQLRSLTSF